MQAAAGERGDLHVTHQQLAPLCGAVDVQLRATGRPVDRWKPVRPAQQGPGDARERQ